ncbi:Tyrosine transporter, partial [Operophtera brumata]
THASMLFSYFKTSLDVWVDLPDAIKYDPLLAPFKLRYEEQHGDDLTPGSLDVWVDLPEAIKYDPLLAPFKLRYEEQHGDDLTPGSLDVWVDLPDAIKYDPLLAPFKLRYEEQHGDDLTPGSLDVWVDLPDAIKYDPLLAPSSSYAMRSNMDSPKWSILLPEDKVIDFSPSATDSKMLILENTGPLTRLNGSQYSRQRTQNGTKVVLRLNTSSNTTVPLTVSYQLDPLDYEDGLIYATAGARPSLPELVSWLDVETLLLLFSMMLLVAILAETGLFDYLAVLAFEVTGGRTWPLINCLCLSTALFSTVLDNIVRSHGTGSSARTDVYEMRQEVAVWRRAAASLSNYSRDEDIVRRALEKK